jgi:hypothetical protein
MATFRNFLGNNSYSVEAAEAEQKLRSKEPKLLHEEETLELAFKSAFDPRDKSYLTSHRILLKDGKGISGKRKNFKSIPYSSIQAFSVETAGGGLDRDTEMKVWNSACGEIKIEFGKGQVDLFAVQQFLNVKVFQNFVPPHPQEGYYHVQTSNQPVSTSEAKGLDSIFDWLGDNAREYNAKEVEDRFKTEYPVLMSDETVELAYKCGRDFTVFTDKRFLLVDVQGILGKSIEFKSISWECIHGFSVETAGAFMDRDCEMRIFTNIWGCMKISQDFRKTKVDLWAIKRCLNNKILGKDDGPLPNIDKHEGQVDPKTSWWGRDNNRPLDAIEMNKVFHQSPPLLQTNEVVEMAFKGIRDMILFTTKRVVKVDPKGWSGTSIEYTSVPWKSIIGFAVKTAGRHLDNDSEVMLWTEMMYKCGNGDDPDEPYMAMWELDFNKNLVDIMQVKTYLSMRCLNPSDSPGPSIKAYHPSSMFNQESGMENLLSIVGSDQQAIDPVEVNNVMHTSLPVLLDGENVVMAFKAGRDMSVFTNQRVLIVDVQGWSGKKTEYTSLPYSSIRAFAVESAGSWDRDSEAHLYTRNQWDLSTLSMDFRKGKVDIVVIQKFLSLMCLGTREEDEFLQSSASSLAIPTSNSGGLDGFLSWITSNSVEEDAQVFSQRLRSDPAILLPEEQCERVYRVNRDLFVYTNLRLLFVDVKGWSGKKVNYLSIPLWVIEAFEVETAGAFDRDAEVYMLCSITRLNRFEQDILVKKGDVMDMHRYLGQKVLF